MDALLSQSELVVHFAYSVIFPNCCNLRCNPPNFIFVLVAVATIPIKAVSNASQLDFKTFLHATQFSGAIYCTSFFAKRRGSTSFIASIFRNDSIRILKYYQHNFSTCRQKLEFIMSVNTLFYLNFLILSVSRRVDNVVGSMFQNSHPQFSIAITCTHDKTLRFITTKPPI